MGPTLKKKKGKKRETQVHPALERIMGYTGSDMSDPEEVRVLVAYSISFVR